MQKICMVRTLVEDIVSQLSAPQPSSRQIIELAQRTTKLGATFLHHWGRAPTSETADLLDEAGAPATIRWLSAVPWQPL
ncbi:hypothetical protein BDZ90DRAFT_108011 [Jaminaea rosea]|uniref:Uncharacterized protein n=1 Tax=Jaminaea rosea TaxID=1569628 RepID=A0A316UWQ4_9BASI|nr:hypothetical protein BDZ90DRAFT_108011 [Jaminaea rosea]PWN29404.1 hypothetical protein BDZ90DRAFT_108011 [Jaminaea rosea]